MLRNRINCRWAGKRVAVGVGSLSWRGNGRPPKLGTWPWGATDRSAKLTCTYSSLLNYYQRKHTHTPSFRTASNLLKDTRLRRSTSGTPEGNKVSYLCRGCQITWTSSCTLNNEKWDIQQLSIVYQLQETCPCPCAVTLASCLTLICLTCSPSGWPNRNYIVMLLDRYLESRSLIRRETPKVLDSVNSPSFEKQPYRTRSRRIA